RDSLGLAAVNLDDDVRDIVTRRAGTFSGNRFRTRHPGNHVLDGLAAFDIAAAVIEHAILGECRDVEVGIVEVEREEISRLQVLDCSAILCITANLASLSIERSEERRVGTE